MNRSRNPMTLRLGLWCSVRLLAAFVTGNGAALDNVLDDVEAIHAGRWPR